MQTKQIVALVLVVLLLVLGGSYFLKSRPVVETVTPNAPSGAKLNINEICDGALAYMTFPDGAAAAAFVAECKEGKYPEVIEEYKRQNGFTDDAAI